MRQESDYMRTQVSGVTYHFYIHGDIGDSSGYIDLLDTLYNASANDVVILHLNTGGGYLDTAIEIIHAMSSTDATVVTSADGLVASAGSLIFFAGAAFIIGSFCEVMLHDGSSGSMGKINETLKSAEFLSKRLSNLYHKVYGRFFTHDEVESVLNGSDLYLDADDVNRLIDKAIEEEANDTSTEVTDE